MKLKKLLIANRGEIACRIIATAKRLGIKTVAIYSTEDSQSLHVRMADEAICVGESHPLKSYLNIPKIIQAIQVSDADSCHPGYGFLSESIRFNQTLYDLGIHFVGPSVSAMKSLGDKIESKLIAKSTGISCIPGFEGEIENSKHALDLARQIGFPIMLKASAGGGGKGMRIVNNEMEIESAWKLTKGEAQSSFGDNRLLVEKYLSNPRHIEIQILGDKHGNVVYLPERECSIQRRNQKLIEETPSPYINDEARIKLGKQAALLAEKVGYDSAGTCEFLVDPKNQQFYFLEMNARLQVEHPITEYITGLDIVEQMILAASGEKLSIRQPDISIRGFSIESRIYAEDPKTFFPSTGILENFNLPKNSSKFEIGESFVRCDSALEQGTAISTHYDSLIAKICTFDAISRSNAVEKLKTALDELVIQGISHNTPLLRDIIESDSFQKGLTTTDFINNRYSDGFVGRPLSNSARKNLLAAAAAVHLEKNKIKYVDDSCNFSCLHISINNGDYSKITIYRSNDLTYEVQIDSIDIVTLKVKDALSSSLIHVEFYTLKSSEIQIYQFYNPNLKGFSLSYQGTMYDLDIKTDQQIKSMKLLPKAQSHKKELIHTLKAPMPGIILSVLCTSGEYVLKNQELCIIEAMKMQNILRAPVAGKIEKVFISQGQIVQSGERLVQIQNEAVKSDVSK